MRARHARALTAATLAALALAGCGGGGARRNDDRPPRPITITAAVGADRVSVSPGSFGAGPVRLLVVNQTGTAQQVTLESDLRHGQGPGIRQQTAPISPQDTATLAADVAPGRYVVRVGDGDIRRATLSVGSPRASSQNTLLLP